MQFLEISAILLTYLSRSEVETFIVKVLLDLLLPLRKLNLLSAFKLVESEIKFSGYNFRNKNCISTISIDTFIQYWSSRPEVFLEISQNSQENTCARDSFLIKLQASGLYQKRDSGTEISKNTFSYRAPTVAASVKMVWI